MDITTEKKSSCTSKMLSVEYYALLREERGLSSEIIDSEANTPIELYHELKQKFEFSLSPTLLRVAINHSFASWEAPLASGDTIVFIPPVAGG